MENVNVLIVVFWLVIFAMISNAVLCSIHFFLCKILGENRKERYDISSAVHKIPIGYVGFGHMLLGLQPPGYFIWKRRIFKYNFNYESNLVFPNSMALAVAEGFVFQSDNGGTFEAQARERYEYMLQSQEKLQRMRIIQANLMKRPFEQPPYSLLICSDANPRYIGGYCVDFTDNSCQCYAYPITVLPWSLHDETRRGNSEEFEMKNLLFALLLWEEKIKEKSRSKSRICIHTDNSAINDKWSIYGKRVKNFIWHFKICEKVLTDTDPNFHINSRRQPEAFAKFIQPADDLSRQEITECVEFLRTIYQIKKLNVTHKTITLRTKSKVLSHTSYFNKFGRKVRKGIKKWVADPCNTCGFMVDETGSLRNSRNDLSNSLEDTLSNFHEFPINTFQESQSQSVQA